MNWGRPPPYGHCPLFCRFSYRMTSLRLTNQKCALFEPLILVKAVVGEALMPTYSVYTDVYKLDRQLFYMK